MAIITALRDRVAKRILDVNMVDNSKVAVRGFVNALANLRGDKSNLLTTNPDDFDLIQVCEIDTHSGVVSNNDVVVLMTGLQASSVFDESEV